MVWLDLLLLSVLTVSIVLDLKTENKIKSFEERLDAVERGEFDDYGKAVDDD